MDDEAEKKWIRLTVLLENRARRQFEYVTSHSHFTDLTEAMMRDGFFWDEDGCTVWFPPHRIVLIEALYPFALQGARLDH